MRVYFENFILPALGFWWISNVLQNGLGWISFTVPLLAAVAAGIIQHSKKGDRHV